MPSAGWLLLTAAIACPFPTSAQSPPPSWTELPIESFRFVSYSSVAAPDPVAGVEFSLPDPPQIDGGWSEACNAHENPKVDLYGYEMHRRIWEGPLAGPVYLDPTNSWVSFFGSPWKGIAAQISFTGSGSGYNGFTLAQAVFIHDERCYRASTEFGFFRYVRGLPSDQTVYFYYEINANCQPQGKCRVPGTGQVLVDQQQAVALPAPSGVNHNGGHDWLYTAFLINGGAQWRIQLLDPSTLDDAASPLTLDVASFFSGAATRFFQYGAAGYISATSTRNGPVLYAGPAPAMQVTKILVGR